jgi:hypothetical protein
MAEAQPSTRGASDVGGIAIRLLDEVYTAWTRAQLECHRAMRAWLDSQDHFDYCVYRAALDREEAAAVDLERLSHIVAT